LPRFKLELKVVNIEDQHIGGKAGIPDGVCDIIFREHFVEYRRTWILYHCNVVGGTLAVSYFL
jgi:hypothetical protein